MEAKITRLREAAAEGKAEPARLVAIVDSIIASAGASAASSLPTALIGGLLVMLRDSGASRVHEAFVLMATALPHTPPEVIRAGAAPLLGAIDAAVTVSERWLAACATRAPREAQRHRPATLRSPRPPSARRPPPLWPRRTRPAPC